MITFDQEPFMAIAHPNIIAYQEQNNQYKWGDDGEHLFYHGLKIAKVIKIENALFKSEFSLKPRCMLPLRLMPDEQKHKCATQQAMPNDLQIGP